MGKENKNVLAARKAVENSMGKREDPFATPEAKIRELKNQRANGLFVGRQDFIDALISEYDKLISGGASTILVSDGNVSLETYNEAIAAVRTLSKSVIKRNDEILELGKMNLRLQADLGKAQADLAEAVAKLPKPAEEASKVSGENHSEQMQEQLEPLPGERDLSSSIAYIEAAEAAGDVRNEAAVSDPE